MQTAVSNFVLEIKLNPVTGLEINLLIGSWFDLVLRLGLDLVFVVIVVQYLVLEPSLMPDLVQG